FPGGILVPQTFGGMANWNPHVHALITDTCWDIDGNAHLLRSSVSFVNSVTRLSPKY
ncbi:MAG: transposase, partial [Candidatus Aegiribacteria sp.]|nr:transposase [Candidatus Aegiribacteria sp.]